MAQQKDPLQSNKIAGGVLVAFLALFFVGYGGNFLFSVDYEADSFPIEVEEEVASTADAGDEAAPDEDILMLLASADVASGEKVAKKCISCHSFNEGGANKVGPNLWNIVGTQMAANDEFSYSQALQEFGGVWDYESLNAFLIKPTGYISGTKMSFAGIRKAQQRADVILYMRAQATEPAPLP